MARPDSKRTLDSKLKAIHRRNARSAKYQTTKIKVAR
jgi:hypothetical protein